MRFDVFDYNSAQWFADIMKVLPSLERLRNIEIRTFSGQKCYAFEKEIARAIGELKNIKKIDLEFMDVFEPSWGWRWDDSFDSETMMKKSVSRSEMVKIVNKRQALRCDLMF